MTEQEIALLARVTGRVQGVSYRVWAKQQADALGISGWVRNEADGSVRALLVGEGPAVEAMIGKLREGPSLARVRGVATEPHDGERPEGFRIVG